MAYSQQKQNGKVTEEVWLEGIQANLIKELASHEAALPRGFNRERFCLNCITLLQDMLRDNEKKNRLKQINPSTIPLCLAKGAYLGLDFFNGECYAIPYGSNMQFQTDYKGEIKLCKRYSKNPIKDIYAKVVRDGDFFEENIESGVQKVNFKPIPFSDAPMIGAFAIVVFKDGSMLYDTMSKKDIEDVRNHYSKAKNSPAWQNSPGEMYKKTVLRRLCKMIDLDFDSIEAQLAFEDGADVSFKDSGIASVSGGNVALPESSAAIDPFSHEAPIPEYMPVRNTAKNPENYVPDKDEFSRFDQAFEQGVISDEYSIPDEMEEQS